jgi:predicted metalloendopeptidase
LLFLEKNLAEKMMTKEDRRNIGNLYNPIDAQALRTKYHAWNWDDFFKAADVASPEQIIVNRPGVF